MFEGRRWRRSLGLGALLAAGAAGVGRAQAPESAMETALGYACYGCARETATAAGTIAASTTAASTTATMTAAYAGRDERGVPHYLRRDLGDEARALLRAEFGIEEPGRLYLSDTLPDATLVYDTDWDGGERDFVASHRVGAPSIRRPGESWEVLERRIAAMRPEQFPAAVRRADTALASLDPVVRPHMTRMLAAARRAGFRVRVVETRRSPERQAYLLAAGDHLTYTATSRHAEGYAIDVIVGDGNLKHRKTRAQWVAFRRWVLAWEPGRFRLIGTPERSWDFPHVEYAEGRPGFHSLEELLDAARWCSDAGADDCGRAWREQAATRALLAAAH